MVLFRQIHILYGHQGLICCEAIHGNPCTLPLQEIHCMCAIVTKGQSVEDSERKSWMFDLRVIDMWI